MALKPELLKKKSLTIYKAYIMQPGETMTVDPGGDTFYTNIKDAVANYLSKIQDIKVLEAQKGSQISILEVNFNMGRLLEDEHLNDIMQDGTAVYMAVKNFFNVYRFKISKYRLVSFDYSVNPKDQGQTLEFSNIELEELK